MPRYQRVTVLTGAGISAESGVPTFRDNGGLWRSHSVMDLAYPAAFLRDPALVQSFYNDRRERLASVAPNAAHAAVARLQAQYQGGTVRLITQNVDDLHERAGSREVIHMHGELYKARCTNTGRVYEWRRDIVVDQDRCACCNELGTLRPHIVWFEEMPMHMELIDRILNETDLFVAIGTSGTVYLAAGFVEEVKRAGGKTVELNLASGENSSVFSAAIYGKATETVPRWVDQMLNDSFTLPHEESAAAATTSTKKWFPWL